MRSTTTKTTTHVKHVATPMNRANGPHLGDLRAFVAECDGLPDEVLVYMDLGTLNESGRRDVTFSAHYEHPKETTDAEDVDA